MRSTLAGDGMRSCRFGNIIGSTVRTMTRIPPSTMHQVLNGSTI